MAEPIDEYFTATISAMSGSARRRGDDEPVRDGSSLTARVCLALFDVALGSRHLDLGRALPAVAGQGLLHHRIVRARGQRRGRGGAAAHRPGAAALSVRRPSSSPAPPWSRVARRCATCCSAWWPQRRNRSPADGTRCSDAMTCTSFRRRRPSRRTCRARVGVAFSIARAKKLGVACAWPDDAITVCSFGDASVNHSTAVGAINYRAARRVSRCADAAAVRLRGQRDRHQCHDTAGLDRADLRTTATAWRISRRTDRIWPRPSMRRPRRPTGCGPVGARRSCTCGRCG